MRTRSVTKEAADHVVDWLKKEPWDQRWPEFQHKTLTTIASRQGIALEGIPAGKDVSSAASGNAVQPV